MNTELYDKVYRALARNQNKAEYYNSKYQGKEEQHTFHGGWNLGYWEGRVSALEDVMELLDECGMKPEIDISVFFRNEFKCPT